MMPGMLPRVGLGKRAGVFYDTRHGHLGWTMSAATARILADSVQKPCRHDPHLIAPFVPGTISLFAVVRVSVSWS